jgi:psp operon transcriptional activator
MLRGFVVGYKPRARHRRAPLLPADLPRRLLDTEKELLLAALDKARFNQRMAADLLNLSYHQFRGKLKKHAISGRPAS